MFGSSFGASLPSSSSDRGFGGTTSNNNEAEAPSLPFAGFGGAAINSKPSSDANKSSESSGFNFGGSTSSTKSSAGVKDSISSAKTNLFASTSADTNKSPPTTSSTLPIIGFGATKSTSSSSTSKTNTSSFAGAASKAAASASKNGTHHVSSSALVPTLSTSTAITTNNNNTSSSSNYNNSLENSCISPNGRSFHSYLYDTTLQKHVIVTEFAPFGDTISSSGGDDNITPRDNNEGITSSLKITTVLPILVQESIAIDNVIGLLCVDGNDNGNDRSKQSLYKHQLQGEEGMKTLPTLCLYTSTSVFLLTIGYTPPDEGDDQKSIQGKIYNHMNHSRNSY